MQSDINIITLQLFTIYMSILLAIQTFDIF